MVMLPPIRPRPIIPSCIRPPSSHAPAARLQRLVVSRRLRADQAREAEVAPGDRQLVAGVVHDLQEEAVVRAALVELAGGVEVARPEAVRDDVPALARTIDELLHLVDARRVDERLDAHVVALLRLREQFLERALRLELDVAAGEHLVGLVLRRLHVGLIERD